MTIYTFPTDKPFISQLALHIKKISADTPDLGNALLLLPSKRACKNLAYRLTQLSITEQPNIIAIGEFADHPYSAAILEQADNKHLLNAPVSSMKRHLMLSKLCSAASVTEGHYKLSAAQALELAGALASLLDEFQRQEINASALQELVPDEYAAHWQRILCFLNIIISQWPEILKSEGLLDPITRRNAIYKCITKHWQEQNKEQKIIIAGSTGSNKAVASMMRCIASRANGEVILPAFPTDADSEYWKCTQPSHPHYYTKRFLDSTKLKESDVSLLHYSEEGTSSSSRQAFLHQSFLPAQLAHRWKNVGERYDLSNIQLIDSTNELEQAKLISIICKKFQQAQHCKNILIVSEKRSFTKLLTTSFDAYGLGYDASEGQALKEDSWAIYFMLILEAALNPLHPCHMLATLKHALFQQSDDGKQKELACKLEESLLRRGKKYHHFAGLADDIQTLEEDWAADALAMLEQYEAATQNLATLLKKKEAPFHALLSAHIECLEQLSSQDESSAELLEFMDNLKAGAEYLGMVDAASYHAILDKLLGKENQGATTDNRSNIRILPSEEARLETADAVIIADFNEGVWPSEEAINPWLSRSMQGTLGFDLDKMRASRMAHDFLMLSHAKHFIITRPLSEDGTQTLTSRWQQRIRFQLLAANQAEQLSQLYRHDYQAELDALEYRGAIAPMEQPSPMPEAAARPSKLSLSDLELLSRDPYSIYAKHILKLRPLEALMDDNTQAQYGMVLHKILELFCRKYPTELPEDGLAQLHAFIPDVLHSFQVDKNLHALWLPKLNAALEVYYLQELQRRPMIKRVASEENLSAELNVAGKHWNIYGRADRVEYYQDGSASIIDYKTGNVPLVREVKNYVACQLPVGAWLLAQQQVKVESSEYWRISTAGLEVKTPLANMQEKNTLAEIQQHLYDLLGHYDQEGTPFTALPDSTIAPKYPVYEQLIRYAEWG